MSKETILVAYTKNAVSKEYSETIVKCISEATGHRVLILPPEITKMEELSFVERYDADN